MKKTGSVLILLVIFSGVLFAGGQQEPAEESVPETLRLAIWGNDARKTLFEDLAAVYTERTGIEVEIILIPFGEFMQKISIQMAAGTAPDVIWLAEKMVPQFMNAGQLVDLSAALESDPDYALDDIFPTTLDLYREGDAIYGVPFAFGPRVIFFNRTLFEERGVPTPLELHAQGNWNLETFYETAERLTDRQNGTFGVKLIPATGPRDWANALYDIVWAFGGDFFTEDMSTFALDDRSGREAIQYYYDMIYTDEIHPKPDDQTQFESGRIGMARDTFSYAANLRQIDDFEWDIAPNPSGPNDDARIASGFANYSVTRGPNVDAAIDLLMYFTSQEVMMELVTVFPAPRRSVLNSDEFLTQPDGKPAPESVRAAFVEPIDDPGVRSLPAHENYQRIDVEMQTHFDLLYAGAISVEEMTAMMRETIQPLLDR